jgi:hypothetical protein
MTKRSDGSRVSPAPLANYANYFEVSHNAFEFLIDFGQFQPEIDAVQLHTRIAAGPTHAKLLAEMLLNSLRRYEAENGRIPDPEADLNPLEVIHRSLPDFEYRAANARRSRANSSSSPSPDPSKKR